MVLESVCPPALLYLAFSIIQIIIDLYRGDSLQALFKFVVMIIFTIVLNAICAAGMSIISWFIVFIPFILMTYITTILFFVFGFNPEKIMNREKKCGETQFGCCNDGVTAKRDPTGRGCPFTPVEWNNRDIYYRYDYERERERRRRERDHRYNPPTPPTTPPVGGCATTRYQCCPGSTTIAKIDAKGSNCALIGTGASTTASTPLPSRPSTSLKY